MKYFHEYDGFGGHRIVLIQVINDRQHRVDGDWARYQVPARLGENLICFTQYYAGTYEFDIIYKITPVEKATVV